jgi:hypothetical protein
MLIDETPATERWTAIHLWTLDGSLLGTGEMLLGGIAGEPAEEIARRELGEISGWMAESDYLLSLPVTMAEGIQTRRLLAEDEANAQVAIRMRWSGLPHTF